MNLILVAISSFLLSSTVESILFGTKDGDNILKLNYVSSVDQSKLTKVNTKWINQPLDHFDETEKRNWNMRYFELLEFYKPGGPIYIFIGGEAEALPVFLFGGMINEIAKETNGAMFMSEHRFYGQSMPLENKGAANLKYLSSRQAIEDLAKLVKYIKSLPDFNNSKVVVIGGSYAGNLAAWFRMLYPNLVDAALASSAPVLAKFDFYEYLEHVGYVLKTYGSQKCYDNIKARYKSIEESFKTPAGIEKLKERENICENSDLNIAENQQLLIYKIAGKTFSTIQHGRVDGIKLFCDKSVNNNEASRLPNYHGGLSIDQNEEKSINDRRDLCFPIDFDAVVKNIRDGSPYYTSWVYQKCAEFSYDKTTSSDNQQFGKYFPKETFYKICELAFGPEFYKASIEKAVRETNKFYGGLDPNVTKVFFTNGDIDPWHRLGILKDLSPEAPAVLIPGSSHCMDLGSDVIGDPPELLAARKRVREMIKQWIGFNKYVDEE